MSNSELIRRINEMRQRLAHRTVIQHVIDRDRGCQFWGHVADKPARGADYSNTPTQCSQVHVVVNTRPDQPLDSINCTLLCTTHFNWVSNHADIAQELELAPPGGAQ